MAYKEKYVIITPARDEESYIENTIKSVIHQTIRPIEWVIVNDGSTDKTGLIIDKYAKQYQWIHTRHRENRGFRKAGGGVIETFYDGYNVLKSKDWNYIVKLDGDLSFDKDYFEKCFLEFNNNPKLGIGGGIIFNLKDSALKEEKNPVFHVRGATKIYKRECWNAIGGLMKAPGWDTLDEVKANMMGYKTQSFAELKLIHHRITGSADGTWQNCVKNGRGSYISGYHPIFMMFKCLKRAFHEPDLIASVGLFYGFISGYFQKIPQVNDDKLIQYLRKQQLRRLLLMKSIWQ
jgi:glycosyltransferase involved in cell wall biosynthesis